MKRLLLTFLVLMLGAGSSFAILPGPIKDFYTPRLGDTTAIVYGTRGFNPDVVRKIELLAHRNADYLRKRDPARVVQVYSDSVFPKDLFPRRSLVLMGTPTSNLLLGEWRNFFPFIQRDGRFNIAGRKLYLGDGVTLSCIFPNPWGTDRYVMLLVGNSPLVLPSLSDWEGDHDFYVAQRHTFPGRYLCRGKFDKTLSLWKVSLTDFERSPDDTVTLVGLVYPYGKVWYPARWEQESLWANPLRERTRMLSVLRDMIDFFEKTLGIRLRGDLDFHFSDRYPAPSAYDYMGRVFLRTHPYQMDSNFFLSWGAPVVRALVACNDAPLDWELFAHRYFLSESFFRVAHRIPRNKSTDAVGRKWLASLTEGDPTYLRFLLLLADRRHELKIGEALDSVLVGGKRYTFEMQEFVDVVTRLVKDTVIERMARLPLRASPYEQKPVYNLGLVELKEWFLNENVEVGELESGTKASNAGLRRGDKIISVDGFPTNYNRSRAYLAWLGKKKGETLKLVIDRKGVRRTLVIPVS